MATRSQSYHVLESAHGKPVVVNRLMVTHIVSRGPKECDVFLVGGNSVALKGTPEEIAAIVFG